MAIRWCGTNHIAIITARLFTYRGAITAHRQCAELLVVDQDARCWSTVSLLLAECALICLTCMPTLFLSLGDDLVPPGLDTCFDELTFLFGGLRAEVSVVFT